MAIQYSGNLLVKVRQRPFAGMLAGAQPLAIQGYRLEPLFNAHHASAMFSAVQPADHWLTATAASGHDVHPWDEAHRVARAAQYSIYVEPDLLQEVPAAPEAAAQQGFDQNWLPAALVSPGWHLAAGFTGFEQVRGNAPAMVLALLISIPAIGRRRLRATSAIIFTRTIRTRPTPARAGHCATRGTERQPWRSSPATPST